MTIHRYSPVVRRLWCECYTRALLPFWRFSKRMPDVSSFLVLALLFWLLPSLDVALSRLFFDEQAGWLFNQNSPWADAIYAIFRDVSIVLLMFYALIISWSIKVPDALPDWAPRKLWLFFMFCLLLGPGLLVHGVMKEGYERPRPRNIEQFGGSEQHIAAFSTDQTCQDCRSFVSGHASMGYYLMVLAWPLRQRRWLALGIASGLMVGIVRMGQGGHFFSDGIFAGYLCYFLYRGLSWFFLGYSTIRPKEKH